MNTEIKLGHNADISTMERIIAIGLSEINTKSVLGNKIQNNIEDNSVIGFLERELKPEYMNDVFTWKQIQDVFLKRLELKI